MTYHVSRNGQVYGPYTREDLDRYIASGHILLTDTAKSDEMTDWVPVSQIVAQPGGLAASPASGAGVPPSGMPQPGPTAPPYAPPAAFGAPPAYPPAAYGVSPAGYPATGGFENPPNLHWGLVLLFDVLTCSLFQIVWNIIIAAWFRRVSGNAKILTLYIVSAVLIVVQGIAGQAVGFMAGSFGSGRYGGTVPNFGAHTALLGIYGLLALGTWVIRLIARFTFMAELQRHYNTVEPIGLHTNGVLTFFFGGIYLQSLLNEVNQRKSYMGLPR